MAFSEGSFRFKVFAFLAIVFIRSLLFDWGHNWWPVQMNLISSLNFTEIIILVCSKSVQHKLGSNLRFKFDLNQLTVFQCKLYAETHKNCWFNTIITCHSPGGDLLRANSKSIHKRHSLANLDSPIYNDLTTRWRAKRRLRTKFPPSNRLILNF